jgi:hypothetical protein
MLDILRRADERRVEDIWLESFLHDLFAFLNQALHRLAFFDATVGNLELVEDFFQARNLSFRLFKMHFKRLSEILASGGFRHLGQRLRERLQIA